MKLLTGNTIETKLLYSGEDRFAYSLFAKKEVWWAWQLSKVLRKYNDRLYVRMGKKRNE